MNTASIINELETNLAKLTRDNEAANDELKRLDNRRSELESFIAMTKTDIDGLEMAIMSLKTTSFVGKVVPEEKVEESQPEPDHEPAPEPEEPIAKKKADPRGGFKKPLSVIMFGPDNNIRTRWSSMNKCAREMGWTIARVRSMIAMDRAVQLRRYGYYLGAM